MNHMTPYTIGQTIADLRNIVHDCIPDEARKCAASIVRRGIAGPPSFTVEAMDAVGSAQTLLATLETRLREDVTHALTVAGTGSVAESMAHELVLTILDDLSGARVKLARLATHVREGAPK